MLNHISLLGIDGIGKSTILELMIQDQSENSLSKKFDIISSPNFHVIDNLSEKQKSLSLEFEKLSHAADLEKNYALKAMVMFFQVNQFKSILNNCKKKFILSFRLPLIDALVYGDIYKKYLSKKLDKKIFKEFILKNDSKNILYNSIDGQILKMGYSWENFEKLQQDLIDNLSRPIEQSMMSLEKIYDLTMIKRVVYLSLDFTELEARLKGRDKVSELHENIEELKYLDQRYREVLQQMQKIIPDFKYWEYSLASSFQIEQFKNLVYNQVII